MQEIAVSVEVTAANRIAAALSDRARLSRQFGHLAEYMSRAAFECVIDDAISHSVRAAADSEQQSLHAQKGDPVG